MCPSITTPGGTRCSNSFVPLRWPGRERVHGRGHKDHHGHPAASQGAPSRAPCGGLAASGVPGAASWSFPPSFEKTPSQPILARVPKYARFPCSSRCTPVRLHLACTWLARVRPCLVFDHEGSRKPLSDRRCVSRHSASPERENGSSDLISACRTLLAASSDLVAVASSFFPRAGPASRL